MRYPPPGIFEAHEHEDNISAIDDILENARCSLPNNDCDEEIDMENYINLRRPFVARGDLLDSSGGRHDAWSFLSVCLRVLHKALIVRDRGYRTRQKLVFERISLILTGKGGCL